MGQEEDDGGAYLAHTTPEGEPERARKAAHGDLADREHLPGIEGRELDSTASGTQEEDAGIASNGMAFKHMAWGVKGSKGVPLVGVGADAAHPRNTRRASFAGDRREP